MHNMILWQKPCTRVNKLPSWGYEM